MPPSHHCSVIFLVDGQPGLLHCKCVQPMTSKNSNAYCSWIHWSFLYSPRNSPSPFIACNQPMDWFVLLRGKLKSVNFQWSVCISFRFILIGKHYIISLTLDVYDSIFWTRTSWFLHFTKHEFLNLLKTPVMNSKPEAKLKFFSPKMWHLIDHW